MRRTPLTLCATDSSSASGVSVARSHRTGRVQTAEQEAAAVDAKCEEMRVKLKALEEQCAALQDRLDRSAEEKSRLRSAARAAMGGADDHGDDASDDSVSRTAGIEGGKADEGFMVDPRRVMRVHKTRADGDISQLLAVVGAGAKERVGQMNVVTIVGTIVEDPVYGYMGGDPAAAGAGAGSSARPTVVRTGAAAATAAPAAPEATPSAAAGDKEESSSADEGTKTAAPTRSASLRSDAEVKEAAALSTLNGQLATASSPPMPVMQLTVRQLGTRPTDFPSPARTFMNTFTVQCRGDAYARLALAKGQRVTIVGHYGVHAVFQLDTTQWQLNPVVDVGPAGFIGVL